MQSERTVAARIKRQYAEENDNKLEALKSLNGKARLPAYVFAYSFGSAGALILGTGMCLCMGVIGTVLRYAMPLGIAVGAAGIVIMCVNYGIFRRILAKRKKKYSEKIIALADQLLNK